MVGPLNRWDGAWLERQRPGRMALPFDLSSSVDAKGATAAREHSTQTANGGSHQ